MAQPPWGRGYVTDTAYITGYYGDLAPLGAHHVCLLCQIEPPPLEGPWVHLDLGCGDGFTNVLLAAANPAARFFAVDFNPSHLNCGRALAEATGVDNITFVEGSFDDLDRHALPPADYVTSHGVLTWVAPDLREALVTFAGDILKPGGTFVVSYNTLPGWLGAVPLQRLLMAWGPSSLATRQRLTAAIKALDDLKAQGGRFFAQYPAAAERLASMVENLRADRLGYLAHEYANRDWQPLYQFEVEALLAGAKFSRVGSLSLTDHFLDIQLSPRLRAALQSLTPDLRETGRDVLLNRTFRREVYSRGPVPLDDEERLARFSPWRALLAKPQDQVGLAFPMPGRQNLVERPHWRTLVAALGHGPKTFRQLARASRLSLRQLIDATALLYDRGQLYQHTPGRPPPA
ncbi:MAG: methyltransferase regulatory domain-containing protein, partial [Candidatus Competibacterales bacterium]